MDPKQLYQEVILDHNRKPRNFGALASPTHRAEGLNPLCGDHIWVALQITDGSIGAIAFEGQSCAICKASASMMSVAVKGRPVADADALVTAFRGMVTGSVDPATTPAIGRLTVFAGIRDLPSRVKCAVLPWHTLHAAIHQEASATTEGDADPVGPSAA